MTHPNIEQRRCAAEILGWAKIIDMLKPTIIDVDKDPMIGTLLRVDLPDAPGEQFIRVLCGTGRDFCIPVSKTCKTALEAQADSWQFPEDLIRSYEV